MFQALHAAFFEGKVAVAEAEAKAVEEEGNELLG